MKPVIDICGQHIIVNISAAFICTQHIHDFKPVLQTPYIVIQLQC